MSQSKAQSLKETLTNTFVGMAGSWLLMMLCMNIFTTPIAIATSSTILCTFWSIGRGYTIRRIFNNQEKVKNA